MVVANDTQRAVRLQQIEAQKAREMGRSFSAVSVSISHLVRENRAMKKREEKCGARKWMTWQPSDALMRLVSGPTASIVRERVLTFCAEAEADRALRMAAEGQGIDPDQWREWINYDA